VAGPGRDVLLTTVQAQTGEETLTPTVRVLGELREPRAISPLLGHLETTTTVTGHAQALTLGAMCDALGQLADRRAVPVLQQFLQRVVAIDRRSNLPKRADNLPTGDPEIPGSIVYASALRALGLLGDQSALNDALRAVNDFDPYVRVQALEAIKRLDPNGEDPRSRQVAREVLNDPRENNIRVAAQLVQQYRDNEARSILQQLIETRPTLSGMAYETLRHLG
jgi:HEAT repeat protein